VDPKGYRDLLAEFGLVPAPGYFSAPFHETSAAEIVETAKQFGAVQAELGNSVAFIAAKLTDARKAQPSIGAGFDNDALQRTIDTLGAAAEAITGQGVRPALHPHVGSLIEVEHEVRSVLDAIPDAVLGFGPDTGHLSWAQMDAVAVMSDYAPRIAAAHLKDVHLDQAAKAREADASYDQATRQDFVIWTEPGRGDVDLLAALAVLPESFSGWVLVEVDVPEAPSNLESTQISGQWVTDNLGADVFGERSL
jgi:inosose dehydratase